MRTVFLMCIVILGALGSPAIPNHGPEFAFWKRALNLVDRSVDDGQSSMEKRFVQAATSDKDLETIAWKEIHPEFEDYSTALMKISKGLRKAVSSGKTKLESQELKDLVALTSAVIKTRKDSVNGGLASRWAGIHDTLTKLQDQQATRVGAFAIVTFCIDQSFFGECTDMTVTDGCDPVPSGFDNAISSANTHGSCVIVYAGYNANDGDCGAPSMTLSDSLGTGYIGDFDDYDFNDVISAVANC